MERQTYTKENSKPKNDPNKWYHPDAICIDEDYGKGGGVAGRV